MPSSFFFIRFVPNRPNFATSMTPGEQATMRAHTEFLQGQLAAGTLAVAGPVLDPAGVFGINVFEAESVDEVRRLLEGDPAKGLGRHEITPMGPSIARPAHRINS
jgi:uncharacterized protein YciI